MKPFAPTRGLLPRLLPALLASLVLATPAAVLAQRGRRGMAPSPIRAMPRATLRPQEPREEAPRARAQVPPTAEGAPKVPLGKGLSELSQLPPEDRADYLRQDPGFQRLPPKKQQQMLRSLDKLNAMSPQQQQRVINRMRDLGKLDARQRAGLEQIFQQFQTMAPVRRQAFRAAYNNLRELPAEQRELRLNQPQFQQRFSSDELKSLRQALDLNLPDDVVGARPF